MKKVILIFSALILFSSCEIIEVSSPNTIVKNEEVLLNTKKIIQSADHKEELAVSDSDRGFTNIIR